uniref:SH2 domain-containing protein n=1 Tax=Periophthalmus magnuspinnatus TaxID=409849 RepID=A0A3B4ANJ0_9GOBI
YRNLVKKKKFQARAACPDDPAQTSRRPPPDAQAESSVDGSEFPLRSPVRCVSPEFVNAIALNPGGRPKERHMHSYREAFEELESTAPPSVGGRSPPGLAKTPLSALGLKPHNPAEIHLNQTGAGTGSSHSQVPSLLISALPSVESGLSTPSQPTTDSGFRSQTTESYYQTPTPNYTPTYTPTYLPGTTPVPPYLHQATPTYLDSSFPSYLGSASPSLSYPGQSTVLGPYSDSAPSNPEPVVHGSPQPLHRTVLSGVHPSLQVAQSNGFENVGLGGSPVFGRRLSPASQRSPVLSRQGSFGQTLQGSPVLGRHPSISQVSGAKIFLFLTFLCKFHSCTKTQIYLSEIKYLPVSSTSNRTFFLPQVSQRSPSLDRHPLHSGYTTPDPDRHGNLSRQSSSSGYQGPPTPCFPLSPAGPQEGGGFRQASPAPALQPLLPEKRRMSSGDRPSTALGYSNTLNGRSSAAAAGGRDGGTPGGAPAGQGYFHTLSDFSRFHMFAIALLRDKEPGAFVIRDSHSFKGAYGLAMKVACPPPTVHPSKKGDLSNELVRHFLIESSPKGVKLKGCPNEPYFGCLSALVYQHAITPLALPCKLLIPPSGLSKDQTRAVHKLGMESLTGPQAVAKAISETLASAAPPTATVVHLKVTGQGITLTDNQRKVFFRRHYPSNTVTFCDTDPQDRKWSKPDGGSAKLFGFVARKQGSTTDNVSHLFAELDAAQPANAIVSFVSKMITAQKR